MQAEGQDQDKERFTRRLEAFSDLVFGFSLSLLATRLEVPAKASGILDVSKAVALLITFALICILWLQHYQIFRRHFVAHPVQVVTNFIFLFGLALLPYALQTFMRFTVEPAAIGLYFGDLALVFICVATMRLGGLLQRRADLDDAVRLRDWKRVVTQYLISSFMIAIVVAVANGRLSPRIPFQFFFAAIAAIILAVRSMTRRVPKFLSAKR